LKGHDSDLQSEEKVILGYWSLTIRLLQLGIPWDFMQELSLPQVMMVTTLASSMLEVEREKNVNVDAAYSGMAAYYGGM
jgi:C4-dicarboxylate transporter